MASDIITYTKGNEACPATLLVPTTSFFPKIMDSYFKTEGIQLYSPDALALFIYPTKALLRPVSGLERVGYCSSCVNPSCCV